MGNTRSRVRMMGGRFMDLSVERGTIPTPEQATTKEALQESQGASLAPHVRSHPRLYLVTQEPAATERVPRAAPLIETASRFGADAVPTDMWRLRRDEIRLLLGVVALVFVWYGVLWLVE